MFGFYIPMTEGKYQAKLTVKFDNFLQTDHHVSINVYGDTLDELNDNAVDFIKDYAKRNNIPANKAEYVIGETKGLVGSSFDVIGRL